MNILYSLNDKFVPQVSAGICSICENNKNEESINFYIISYGISSKNKIEMKKLVNKYKRTIEILELEDLHQYFDFDFDTLGWNKVILARLLMGSILPKKIKRIIYLDGDTIVRGSLTELWNLDIQNKIIGMSIEPTADKKRRADLKIENYPYYNSGVILVDLQKWRKYDIENKVITYYKKQNGRLFAADQDVLNYVLRDKIFTISLKYNYYNIFDQYSYNFCVKLLKPIDYSKYITQEEYNLSKKNPIIIHYLGEERPWRLGNTHRYRKDYKKYLSMTFWKDTPDEKGWKFYFILWKTFNFMFKCFPQLRYHIINSLIPKFMKYRKRKLACEKKNEIIHTYVVLAYKESEYLEECIRSVINQKYKSNVVIATSTPNEFIKKIASKYKLDVIVNKDKKGIGYDFDFAISCGRTELVTIAHQDDIYDYFYSYEVVKKYTKNKKSLILFSDYYEIKNNQKVYTNLNLKIKRILLFSLKFGGKSKFSKRLCLRFGNAICCPAVTFANNNIDLPVFGYPMKCDIDWHAWEVLSKEDGAFSFVNKKLMGHRVHENSTTTEIIKENVRTKEDLKILKRFWPNWIAHVINHFYKKSEKSNNN